MCHFTTSGGDDKSKYKEHIRRTIFESYELIIIFTRQEGP